MLKDLKGTREQRIKAIEDSKQTFASLVKQIATDSDFRVQIGFDMEKMRLAAEKEKERLSDYYTYEDGMVDQPFLTPETLKQEDAYQFPLVGSLSLFSLYMAFKYLGQEFVNMLIGGYFCLVGTGALTMTIAPAVGKFLPTSTAEKKLGFKKKVSHSLPSWILPTPLDVGFEFTISEFIAFLGSAVIVYFYFQEKHWTLNNVLGICFCLQGIERFSLGTYKIGAILLIGLFFYDIFWVFGTDVMVTVAKNLDGPIKLLFPRSLIPKEESGKIETSLLGLGDIVIPGKSDYMNEFLLTLRVQVSC